MTPYHQVALAVWVGLAGTAAVAAGCAPAGDERPDVDRRPLRVFAAASLSPVLDGLTDGPNAAAALRARCSYAASSTLARQIAAGADADVFVSANPAWMDWLQERGGIVEASRRDGPGNSLVLVAPRDADFEWSPASGVPLPDAFTGRLALADPSHVPAGIYARQALQRAGWGDGMARRVVATLDVRAALTLVEHGECAAGIVYGSDASSSGRCRIVAVLPESWHEPVRYVAAAVAGADTARALAWLDAFGSPAASRTLQAHGFRTVAASAP